MSTLGGRLRAERERLGLSQEALGEVGGVKKLAQINYEKGKRHPDAAYLAAIAAAGIDVLYVLTGDSGHGVTGESNRQTSAGLTGDIDEDLMRRIVTMLAKTAQDVGRRWDSERLMLAAVDVYKFLAKEEIVDDDKLERVLKLVVNR